MKTVVTPLQKLKSLHGLFCVDEFLVKGIEGIGTRNLRNLIQLNIFYHKFWQTGICLVAGACPPQESLFTGWTFLFHYTIFQRIRFISDCFITICVTGHFLLDIFFLKLRLPLGRSLQIYKLHPFPNQITVP
jgi:hypothetical protein